MTAHPAPSLSEKPPRPQRPLNADQLAVLRQMKPFAEMEAKRLAADENAENARRRALGLSTQADDALAHAAKVAAEMGGQQ